MKMSLLIPFLASIATLATGANAGEERKLTEQQVPKPVLEAFHQAYPKATEVEFEEESKAGKTVYEIEFKHQGAEREVTYSADGSVLKTEKDDEKGEDD